ncbi:hypothetical protein [Aquimarina algicola]|uniref:Uncharacterized protein n=1 Tax=Aquimarina algicola TaxID=2589995 RepID=A0A504JAS4_9FLAO|nr:hypothetical protein [Aquimarina algicola]TPN87774.1 hypothetical protein FHK87_09375 [Aquimarina algicola]
MVSTSLLIVVTFAFAAYIYKYPPKKPSLSQNKQNICMDYSHEPAPTLKVNLIHEMTNGYRQNQLDFIKRVITDDAHSIWFDLETLKKFIYHIEFSSKKNNVSSKDLGVRIYYSRYPEIETWEKKYPDLSFFLRNALTKSYQKRHTLIMIPTIHRDKIDIDFNPDDIRTYTQSMRNIEDYLSSNDESFIPALTITKASKNSSSSSPISQNHGSLIPPANGSGEAF